MDILMIVLTFVFIIFTIIEISIGLYLCCMSLKEDDFIKFCGCLVLILIDIVQMILLFYAIDTYQKEQQIYLRCY